MTHTFYSRGAKNSFFWLGAAALLGGVPLVVYFENPHAPIVNLFIGVIAGSVFVGVFLWELLGFRAIQLCPTGKRFQFVKGFLKYQSVEEFSYSDVRGIDLRKTTLSSRGGASTWFEIHVLLNNGRRLVLEKPTAERTLRRAEELCAVLGVDLAPGSRARLGF